MTFEPSNLCNANCVFCGYQFQTRPHANMPLDRGLEIIEAAKKAGIKYLVFTGTVGEPLVHKNLEAFVRAAKADPGLGDIGIITNGILLTKDRYLSLADAGAGWISISMTYPDEDEYVRIYRSQNFKRVIRNIENILDLPDAHSCQMRLAISDAPAALAVSSAFRPRQGTRLAIGAELFFRHMVWTGNRRIESRRFACPAQPGETAPMHHAVLGAAIQFRGSS